MENIESPNRILEIDFVKGVLVALMVLFHLSEFNKYYPSLTAWVYTYHMSGFLFISGYLFKVNRSYSEFLRSIRTLIIPYLIFEIIYFLGLGIAGKILYSSNQIELSFTSLINCVLITPIGTYWYLHTLMICMCVYYFINKLKHSSYEILLITGCLLFFISLIIDGFHWMNVIYFILGAILKRFRLILNQVVIPSILSLIPIVLISYWGTLDRGSLSGVTLTIFMLSFLMALYKLCASKIKLLFVWLGCNSLAIVLFSPIFTVLTKFYTSLFDFDSTHILWAVFSLLLVIVLCLLSSVVVDKIGVSKLWGRRLYNKLDYNLTC